MGEGVTPTTGMPHGACKLFGVNVTHWQVHLDADRDEAQICFP